MPSSSDLNQPTRAARVLAALDAIVSDGTEGDASVVEPEERYERLEVIGLGGVGCVWRAWDRRLAREVALKEPRSDRAAGDPLAAEVAVLTRLGHPNVVPIYDAVLDAIDGRTRCYVMPLLPGPTLREASVAFHAGSTGDGPAFRRLIAAYLDVCRAVCHAHGRGVRHLDLKGDNIRLGPLNEAVVLDWGLAEAGRRGGTPGYLAPEQATGGATDDATDVHGLGAVLYELLTGQPPHAAADAAESLRRVGEIDPAPPRLSWPDAPAELASVCLKALSKRPADRYPSAAALLADVEAWIADRKVAAHRERPWERAGRFIRRHQRSAAGLAAGLILALAALAFGLWQADRQRRAAEHALAAEQESFRLALRTGREAYGSVADLRLSSGDGRLQLRLDLARQGLIHFQTLLESRPHDSAVLLETAIAWERVGGLTCEAGRMDEAATAYLAAVPLYEGLCGEREPPPDARTRLPYCRVGLAFCLIQLGRSHEAVPQLERAEAEARAWRANGSPELLHLLLMAADARGIAARPPEAEAAYADAVRYGDLLVESEPNQVGHRYWRGLMRLQLAIRQKDRGRSSEALITLSSARADFDRVGVAWNWSTAVRQRMSACVNMAGVIAVAEGRYAEAAEAFTEAIGHRRALLARNPDAASARGELGTSLANLGRAYLALGRPADAIAPAREGCMLAEAVFRLDPSVVFARYAAGRFRTRAGLIAAALGEWDRAAVDLKVADEILAPLVIAGARADPEHRRQAAEAAVWRGLVAARRGRWSEAAEAWCEAARLNPPNPTSGG